MDGQYIIESSDIELTDSQQMALQSLPTYYDELVLEGYVDGHHLCIESASCGNTKLSEYEFTELLYEAHWNALEFITNRIEE